MPFQRRVSPVQLVFRDPTSKFVVSSMGFYHQSNQLYVKQMSMWRDDSTSQTLEVDETSFHEGRIYPAKVRTISLASGTPTANLPTAGPRSWPKGSISTLKGKYSFLFRRSREPRKFDLGDVFVINHQTGDTSKVIGDIRQRLFSINPGADKIIFSVYHYQKGNQTWLVNSDGTGLKLIANELYNFLSWINDSEYLCTTKSGFYHRSVDGSRNEKLDDWPVPEWCKKINLEYPKYEIQVACEEDQQKADSLLQFLEKKGFKGRKELFEDRKVKCYRVRVGQYPTLKAARIDGKKLSTMGFNFWIDKIEDRFGYVYKVPDREEARFGDMVAIIENNTKYYLRSRILLKKGKETKLWVEEMNNFGKKIPW